MSKKNKKHHPKTDSWKVPFGLKDGVMYEPKQVENGLACGCICPSCKAPLEAVLDARGVTHQPSNILRQEGIFKLQSVRLEESVSDFKPDLIAIDENGAELLIEIAVTSFVGEDKLEKVKKYGRALVEINASEVSIDNFEQLTQLLFEPDVASMFKWIYHPEIVAEENRLYLELKPILEAIEREFEAERREHELALKIEREQKRIAELERELNPPKKRLDDKSLKELSIEIKKKQRAFKRKSLLEKMNYCLDILEIDDTQIPSFIDDSKLGVAEFGIPSELWKIAIFTRFVEGRFGSEFALNKVFNWLGHHFESNQEFLKDEYLKVGRIKIKDFLLNLIEYSILSKRYDENSQLNFTVLEGNLKKILSCGVSRKSGYIWEPTATFAELYLVGTHDYAVFRGKKDY